MSEPFLSRWARLKRGQADKPGEPHDADRASVAAGEAAAPKRDPEHAGEPGVAGAPATEGQAAGTGDQRTSEGTQGQATQVAGLRREDASDGPSGGAAPSELPPLDTLTPQSDFRPFLRAGVAPETRNAALKTLFSDPHFNVMDGLDVYIDDYNQTVPIPQSVMRRLVQAKTLRLFDDTPEAGQTPPTASVAPQALAAPQAGPDEAATDETVTDEAATAKIPDAANAPGSSDATDAAGAPDASNTAGAPTATDAPEAPSATGAADGTTGPGTTDSTEHRDPSEPR